MTTGREILREALRSFAFKNHIAPMARDLDVGVSVLDGFINGSPPPLPAEVCDKLAKVLFGANVRFDPQRDLLVRVTSPARLLGINWDHPDGRQVEHARQAALLREPMW
jgi:hypothetical protein